MKTSAIRSKSLLPILSSSVEYGAPFVKTVGKPYWKKNKPKKENKLGKKDSKLPKLPSLAKLKKKLWKIVSDYIRNRDRWTCFTCGRVAYGKAMHAGHFVPKSLGSALYFEENNIHAQCYKCNLDLDGYGPMYYERMLAKYGQKEIDRLQALKNTELHLDRLWYDKMFPVWRAKLASVQNSYPPMSS